MGYDDYGELKKMPGFELIGNLHAATEDLGYFTTFADSVGVPGIKEHSKIRKEEAAMKKYDTNERCRIQFNPTK